MGIMLRMRTLPAGFIAPCLPTKTDKLPSGGYGCMRSSTMDSASLPARMVSGCGYTAGPGNDSTRRFPLIVDALSRLRARSCIIDGEAAVCDDNRVASFDRIRYRRHDGDAFLYFLRPDRVEWRRHAA